MPWQDKNGIWHDEGETSGAYPGSDTSMSWGQGIMNGLGKLWDFGSNFVKGMNPMNWGTSTTFLSYPEWMKANHNLDVTSDAYRNLGTLAQQNYQNLYNQAQKTDLLAQNMGFGPNLATGKFLFDIGNSIGQWWQAGKANDLAQDQLAWTKRQWTDQYNMMKENRDRLIAAQNYNRGAVGGENIDTTYLGEKPKEA